MTSTFWPTTNAQKEETIQFLTTNANCIILPWDTLELNKLQNALIGLKLGSDKVDHWSNSTRSLTSLERLLVRLYCLGFPTALDRMWARASSRFQIMFGSPKTIQTALNDLGELQPHSRHPFPPLPPVQGALEQLDLEAFLFLLKVCPSTSTPELLSILHQYDENSNLLKYPLVQQVIIDRLQSYEQCMAFNGILARQNVQISSAVNCPGIIWAFICDTPE